MNTKLLSSTRLKNPTGKDLWLLIALTLAFFALTVDGFTGGFPRQSLLMPLVVSAAVSSGLGYWVIPILQQLKTGQIVQADGPKTHLQKAGTPTMGGLFFVPVGVVVALLWSGLTTKVLAVSALTLLYCAIGWLDDWQVIKQKSNKGISPRLKLILQIIVAAGFCLWAFLTQPVAITTVALPLQIFLPLGLFFWLLAGFVIVAESNATNLTDGVDGLAGGTAAIAFGGLAILLAESAPDLMLFCAALSGACLGFVWHNHHKAKVFMGDTGSLALGPALAGVAILTNNLWSVFILSGIFFIESLSVIAQVSYYKATKGPDGKGKRLLKMAPIHHHLELSGWSETQIVGVFYLINLGLVVIALLFH